MAIIKEDAIKQQVKQIEEKSAVDDAIDLDDIGEISNDLFSTIKYATATDRRAHVRKLIDDVIVRERSKALVKGQIPVNLQAQNIQYGFECRKSQVTNPTLEFVFKFKLPKTRRYFSQSGISL